MWKYADRIRILGKKKKKVVQKSPEASKSSMWAGPRWEGEKNSRNKTESMISMWWKNEVLGPFHSLECSAWPVPTEDTDSDKPDLERSASPDDPDSTFFPRLSGSLGIQVDCTLATLLPLQIKEACVNYLSIIDFRSYLSGKEQKGNQMIWQPVFPLMSPPTFHTSHPRHHMLYFLFP